MGFRLIIQPSVQSLIISSVVFLYNFRFVRNSAALSPANISSIWNQTQSSSQITTDVLQNPSFITLPNSNRIRKSIMKKPKVNYQSAGAGGSQDEEDDYYEEDTSNFKVSKTIEVPPPPPPLPPSNKMNDRRPPLPAEGELRTANLRSKAKDARNIEIDIAFPRPQQQYLPPPVRIPTRQSDDDDEDYDESKLPKISAVVSPEEGQLSTKLIKSVADAVAESILNDADRWYESLENGDSYKFTNAACSEDSSYFLC